MKVYISADIEGIGCIVRQEQSSPEGREFAWARKMMTEEVNAAARGAFDGGATEVVVADSHNVGLNLIPEDLDERISIVMGSPRPLSMMEGVKAGFDATFLVGYHGMAGTADSTIVHIFMGRIAEVRVNDLPIGEIGISAALAGHYNVPVALVTGDENTVAEAKKLLNGIETVAVKKGIGAYAALCLSPKRSRSLIYEGAKKAMSRKRDWRPFRFEGRVDLQVGFTTASAADRAEHIPGVERVNGRTVRFSANDFIEAFRAFHTMADLMDLVKFI
ncbi:MAG: M55 family metallopeptidase [Desulfatiglandaceae bacterium]